MKTLRSYILALLVVLAVCIAADAATIVHSEASMIGLHKLYVTSTVPAGATVAVTADTTGSGGSKKAMIHKFTVGGNEFDVLIRVQTTGHGVYVDLVGDATITSLSTTAASLNITTSGHPTPAKDATDTAALVAAGGS